MDTESMEYEQWDDEYDKYVQHVLASGQREFLAFVDFVDFMECHFSPPTGIKFADVPNSLAPISNEPI